MQCTSVSPSRGADVYGPMLIMRAQADACVHSRAIWSPQERWYNPPSPLRRVYIAPQHGLNRILFEDAVHSLVCSNSK